MNAWPKLLKWCWRFDGVHWSHISSKQRWRWPGAGRTTPWTNEHHRADRALLEHPVQGHRCWPMVSDTDMVLEIIGLAPRPRSGGAHIAIPRVAFPVKPLSPSIWHFTLPSKGETWQVHFLLRDFCGNFILIFIITITLQVDESLPVRERNKSELQRKLIFMNPWTNQDFRVFPHFVDVTLNHPPDEGTEIRPPFFETARVNVRIYHPVISTIPLLPKWIPSLLPTTGQKRSYFAVASLRWGKNSSQDRHPW